MCQKKAFTRKGSLPFYLILGGVLAIVLVGSAISSAYVTTMIQSNDLLTRISGQISRMSSDSHLTQILSFFSDVHSSSFSTYVARLSGTTTSNQLTETAIEDRETIRSSGANLSVVFESECDLPVPYEGQGNSGWCWAASTAMVLRYYGKNVHVWDVGKTEIATFWFSQIESYIQKTYPTEFETKIGAYSSISEQVPKDIEGNLSSRYPVMLNVDPPGGGMHIVVVTGFNSSGFFINDPSGALFNGMGRPPSFPYIHEFATWEELRPYVAKQLGCNNVFLVVGGTPSPLDATLFLINDEAGIRTIHNTDEGKGVYIDYGGYYWAWGPYWRSVGWHPVAWDSKDNLNYLFEIFNHKDQEATFDFNLQIRGDDRVIYYEKTISGVLVPGYDSKYAGELNIPLNDYLVQGKQYVISAEIMHHGSSEIIDSITLPPIYYGVKSILFASECPVRMLVTDPDGLSVGYNATSNQTINQIPDAIYYYGNGSVPEVVAITKQKTGNYSVKVIGIENGVYNLTCTSIDQTGALSTEPFSPNISIQQGESQNYVIQEFPSSTIITMFMMSTLLGVIIYRRKCVVTK